MAYFSVFCRLPNISSFSDNNSAWILKKFDREAELWPRLPPLCKRRKNEFMRSRQHVFILLYLAFIIAGIDCCSVLHCSSEGGHRLYKAVQIPGTQNQALKLRGGGETALENQQSAIAEISGFSICQMLCYLALIPAGFDAESANQDISPRIVPYKPVVAPAIVAQEQDSFIRCGATDPATILRYGVVERTPPSFQTSICSAQIINGFLVCDTSFDLLRSNKIYVRKCYEEIADDLIRPRNSTNPVYVIVSGTPGVGKSVFSNHLLWRLIKEGKRVLFMSQPAVYYDGEGGVFDFLALPAGRSELWGPDLWVLIDSKDPISLRNFPYAWCSIVLFTTARADITSEFLNLKPVPIEFWIPVWNKDEIKALAEGLYTNNINDWENRFDQLGGVPRHIFECSKDPRDILHNACVECDFETCTRVITLKSPYTAKSKVSQVLIHINSTSPYHSCEVTYASTAAVKMIVHKFSQVLRSKMERLLSSCTGNRLTAALCRYIFEPYAWQQLARGGDFKCRKLVSGHFMIKPKPFTISVPTSPQSPIEVDAVDAQHIVNQLYVPTTTNYAAIDAWIPGFGGLQMTVGKKHGINRGAVDDLQKLGAQGNKLYFIVSPLYFHSFTQKTPRTIVQYALQVDYPPVLGKRSRRPSVADDADSQASDQEDLFCSVDWDAIGDAGTALGECDDIGDADTAIEDADTALARSEGDVFLGTPETAPASARPIDLAASLNTTK